MPDLLAKLSPDRESYFKIPFTLSYHQIFAGERLPFSLPDDNYYYIAVTWQGCELEDNSATLDII
ncbi:hypothetical protein EL009_05930 [Salmonella enterica subsp. salamae serovar 42:r:-]|nr:hypothetical protein EL003_05890 [Salmonella enterica subsp. salamae serovar 42:r:-]AZT54158.1 hypothetical protein EL009_05930 [Salmonella enterica subsp. salamae serovar 42:r:-]